jgi:Conserved hypothetical protein (DUF2461)
LFEHLGVEQRELERVRVIEGDGGITHLRDRVRRWGLSGGDLLRRERFLRQLTRNNDREWFAENKERYVHQVQEPVLRFVTDVGAGLGKISTHLVADPRPAGGSTFRIHRDTAERGGGAIAS